MTDAVDPSINKTVDDRLQAVGQRYSADDWVVPSDRDVAASRIGFSGTPLNAFASTTSTSSFDVDIDTGEAFVEGKYIATDTTTTVTVASSTQGQTIYVGSNDADTNTVTIGLDGDFSSPYSRIPLFDIATDTNGVTSTTDRRRIGEPVDGVWHNVTDPDGAMFSNTSTGIDFDTGTLPRAWDRYRVVISHENHAGSEEDINIRVNGVTATDYVWDAVDGFDGTIDSRGSASEWQDIARASSGEIAHQTLEIARPRAVAAPGTQHPIISTTTPGVAKQRDFLLNGTLDQDPGLIDQLRVFGGSNSTGTLRIFGADV